MNIIPISKEILEPIIKTAIIYVNSLEEFEKIELEVNETVLAFDNFKQCFYTRERDKYGEYSPVMIYFYKNFAQTIQDLEKEDFEKKCRQAGLNEVKTLMAYLFFRKNYKPQQVWEHLLKNDIKDYSWDYVRNVRCKLKKQLHEVI